MGCASSNPKDDLSKVLSEIKQLHKPPVRQCVQTPSIGSPAVNPLCISFSFSQDLMMPPKDTQYQLSGVELEENSPAQQCVILDAPEIISQCSKPTSPLLSAAATPPLEAIYKLELPSAIKLLDQRDITKQPRDDPLTPMPGLLRTRMPSFNHRRNAIPYTREEAEDDWEKFTYSPVDQPRQSILRGDSFHSSRAGSSGPSSPKKSCPSSPCGSFGRPDRNVSFDQTKTVFY